MSKYYIGVDLGLSGGLAFLEDQKVIACEPMPVIQVKVGKKMRNQYDINEIEKIIDGWCGEHSILKGGFERLRAIPGQMSQTAFSMGFGSGIFKALFTFFQIPFVEVEPRSWQKEVFGKLGIQYDKTTTKQASVQAAKQLFPGVDFKPTERCSVYSDGMCDASNIGYFISKL